MKGIKLNNPFSGVDPLANRPREKNIGNNAGPSFANVLASTASKAPSSVLPAGEVITKGIAVRMTGKRLDVPLEKNTFNGCARTSLLMVMEYYRMDTGSFEDNYSFEDTDLPYELVGVAEELGLDADLKEGGTIGDLTALIDAGVPPVIFGHLQDTPAGSGHCVVVSGYERDDSGQVTKVFVNDPNKDVVQEYSYEQFMDFWSSGSPNTYVTLLKPGSLYVGLPSGTSPTTYTPV